MDRRTLLQALAALPFLSCTDAATQEDVPPNPGSLMDWPEAPQQFDVPALESLARKVEDLGAGELVPWIQAADQELRQLAAIDPDLGAVLGAGLAGVVGGGFELLISLAEKPPTDSLDLTERFNGVLSRDTSQLREAFTKVQDRFDDQQPDQEDMYRAWHLCQDQVREALRTSGDVENPLALYALASQQQDALALRDTPTSELMMNMASALDLGTKGPPPPSADCSETEMFWENYKLYKDTTIGLISLAYGTLKKLSKIPAVPALSRVLFVRLLSFGITFMLIGLFAGLLLLPFLLYTPGYPAVSKALPIDFCACGAF